MLEPLFSLLQIISGAPVVDQRTLAARAGVSVGKVNALLRQAEQEGYLLAGREGKKSRFTLTPKGRQLLEDTLIDRSGVKLSFPPAGGADTAVILAGGRRSEFDIPVCLQPIGEEEGVTIIDRMLRVLSVCGVSRYIIIAGWQADALRAHFAGRGDLEIVYNERYKWNGTMSGLALAEEALGRFNPASFLVLKSDLVFEQRGVQALLETDAPFAALLTSPSGSRDEVLAELDGQGDIFRFSKDVRQINRVQGEMTGIARISMDGFRMMMRYFSRNLNPLIGFEYVMESIGRIYRFQGVMVDDLRWGKVETREDYEAVNGLIYPRIERKERQMREKLARDTIEEILPDEPVEEVQFAGGMTNTNYFVKTSGGRYILRLPGRMTESMINRENEKRNAQIASDMGFNCTLLYCNAETGVKLSRYIDGAETLTPRTARLEENITLAADILHRLHHSGIVWENRLDVFEESLKYEGLLGSARMYDGFEEVKALVYGKAKPRLEALGPEDLPCHNDLVAANLVKNSEGRLYLIDWEYSGQNDPAFDLAALFLENDFTPEDEELFFHYYYGDGSIPETVREKILIFKIMQDYLWSIWTVVKEARGDNFGSYGPERFNRARKNLALWQEGLAQTTESTEGRL